MSGAPGSAATPRKILVACLGNPDCGDDGIGAAIAEKLAGRLPPDVTLLARRGDMLSLISDWAGFDALILVDAAASVGEPGCIHRIDLATEALPHDLSFTSSHAFGPAEAIGLARTLGLAPAEIVVYAVEGAAFEGAAAMTSEVAAAADEAAVLVAGEAKRLRHSVRGTPCGQIDQARQSVGDGAGMPERASETSGGLGLPGGLDGCGTVGHAGAAVVVPGDRLQRVEADRLTLVHPRLITSHRDPDHLPRSASRARASTTHCGWPVSLSTFCCVPPKSRRGSGVLVTVKATWDVSSIKRMITTPSIAPLTWG